MAADTPAGCFHCGLPVPAGAAYPVTIEGEPRSMCCAGCQAVAQAIVSNGLLDFYRFRTGVSTRPDELIPAALLEPEVYDHDSVQQSFVKQLDGEVREAALLMEGIVCAACVWLNERHVRQLPGVLDFRVNYSTHRASLKWDNAQLSLSAVLRAIRLIGYQAHPFDTARLENLQKKEKAQALRRVAVAGLGMMQIMMISLALYMGEYAGMSAGMQQLLRWASLLVALPVVLYASRVFFIAAWRDLKQRQLGMDVPVALAIGVAFSASVWATLANHGEVYFDSVVMFTFFLLTGRFLEMTARHKAGQVAEALVRLAPATAVRLEGEQQHTVAVSELVVGERVLIRPGELVPADGVVLSGSSSVNESLLTGESLPCDKTTGDALVAGTVNIASPLVMRVEQLGEQTVLAAIVRLLDRAQAEKPRLALLAERVAARFVLVILLLALVVFVGWSWFAGTAEAFRITLSVLVVTCPCALSLATPAALTAATGLLTSRGVLTTRGHALETLAGIDQLVLDKTGTLTVGQPRVDTIRVFSELTQQQCIDLAAGLETASEHPLAQALLRLSTEPVTLTALQHSTGHGIQGEYQGQTFRIGTMPYVSALSVKEPSTEALPAGLVDDGVSSRIFLGSTTGLLAMFVLSDTLRPEALAAMAALRELGIELTLLSGDRTAVSEHIAAQLGIAQVYGEQLPQDKLQYVQQLQQQGHVVAMIGDGVNDAPVLAGSAVSLAMGSGSQLAQATADMVLLSGNLLHLPYAVRTARRMRGVIRQNFGWAVAYNVLAIPLAAGGIVAPWMAAIGMSLSSLVVVLNALRLRQ